ncbi:MAG: hypothetical protein Kow0068_26210 [Marinilabiliales bacterium]
MHVSILPDEALNYVNTVVVGDVENIWPQLIDDFEKGDLKRLYNQPLATLDNLVVQDHSIYNKGYWYSAIQTTRGCPNNCSFCSINALCKGKYLSRPAEEVLYEIEIAPKRMVCFVDDNFIGNTSKEHIRASKILEGMIKKKMNKIWWTHISLNVAQNEDFLELAAKSGCKMFFIGIESEITDSLKEVNKNINLRIAPENYIKTIKKIHKYGINVLGSMIYGFDADTYENLYKRTKFLLKSNIDIIQVLPLIPFPGTQVFNKFKSQNRLLFTNFPNDWVHYDGLEVTYIPANMTDEQLSSNLKKTYKTLYAKYAIYRKFLRTFLEIKNYKHAKWSLVSNYNYRKIYYPGNK